jgi:hypothetical protein
MKSSQDLVSPRLVIKLSLLDVYWWFLATLDLTRSPKCIRIHQGLCMISSVTPSFSYSSSMLIGTKQNSIRSPPRQLSWLCVSTTHSAWYSGPLCHHTPVILNGCQADGRAHHSALNQWAASQPWRRSPPSWRGCPRWPHHVHPPYPQPTSDLQHVPNHPLTPARRIDGQKICVCDLTHKR